MIEQFGRIENTAIDAALKMQMFRRGSAGTPRQGNHLTGLHAVAHLHQIL